MFLKILVTISIGASLFKSAYGFCSTSCNCNSTGITLGYYWRDYFGTIPHDAVRGGLDKSGGPTYIGQVYSKDYELLPATIYPNCLTATTTAYNKRLEVEANIKILCSNEQDKLSWVATNVDEMQLLTNCHLIVGGSEDGHTLSIGRVNSDGQTVIGKVFSYPLANSGLWIPRHNHELKFMAYEVLAYNCNPRSSIDVRYQH